MKVAEEYYKATSQKDLWIGLLCLIAVVVYMIWKFF